MQDLYRRSQRPPSAVQVGWSHDSGRVPPILNLNANTFFHNVSTATFAPTRVLNDRIRAREWDSARIRVLSHPSDSAFRSKQMNNATPLHLACLYRAPADLVQMVLEANPEALFCQDSEGWTPIHVILLYGSNEETALMLIRRGGFRAASMHSRIVGAPLHLACRHGSSTTILQELLRVNPGMATCPNEYSTKPAKILWHQFLRNPESQLVLKKLWKNNPNSLHILAREGKCLRDLVDRLSLLVRAAKGKVHCSIDAKDTIHRNLIHDVLLASEDTLGDLTQYLSLLVLLHPEQVRLEDEMGNLPLHNAASNRPSRALENRNLRCTIARTPFALDMVDLSKSFYPWEDSVDILIHSYPSAATMVNDRGLLPLHIALAQGRRTWRTGIASMVRAAPQALMQRDPISNLLPFQSAATLGSSRGDCLEVIETILELLLACPHAMFGSE